MGWDVAPLGDPTHPGSQPTSCRTPPIPATGTSTWHDSGAPFVSWGEWWHLRVGLYLPPHDAPTTPHLGPVRARISSHSPCAPIPTCAWHAVGAQQGSPWTPGTQHFYCGTPLTSTRSHQPQAASSENLWVSLRTEGGGCLHAALKSSVRVWDSELWNSVATS